MQKMFNAVAAMALTAGLATTAHAESKPTTQTESVADAADTKAGKAKRYCVEDSTLGSRIRHKVCKTRAQWIADDNFDPLAPER